MRFIVKLGRGQYVDWCTIDEKPASPIMTKKEAKKYLYEQHRIIAMKEAKEAFDNLEKYDNSSGIPKENVKQFAPSPLFTGQRLTPLEIEKIMENYGKPMPLIKAISKGIYV